MIRYTFDNSQHTLFNALKTRVDQYFVDSKLHRAGNRKLYIKAILLIGLAAGLYALLVFYAASLDFDRSLCGLGTQHGSNRV